MDTKELVLVSKSQEARDTVAFRFRRQDLRFEAGQAADWTVEAGGKRSTHTFSIASSPENRDTVMVATRIRDTRFKHALASLEPGDKVRVEAPNGNFLLPKDAAPVVFVTGGIGITPMRSMLKHMLDTGDRRRAVLLYSNPALEDAAFLDELRSWQDGLDLDLVPTLTRDAPPDWPHERGRIDEAMLRRHLDDGLLRTAVFYISGPPGMVKDLKALVAGLGVPEDRIKTDDFTGY